MEDRKDVSGLEYHPQGERLLPEAEEIKRLRKIDPLLVLWIMDHSAKEQKARHDFDTRKLALIEAEQRRLFKTDRLTIISAFLLMAIGMLLSYLLLIAGLTTTGGVFAGSTMIFAVIAFLNFRRQAIPR